MAIKVTKELNDALNDYGQVIQPLLTNGSSGDYCTYIRVIENELQQPNQPFNLLEEWILPQITQKDIDTPWDLLDNVLEKFDNAFATKTQIGKGKYAKSQCRSALASFTKYILGQYKANLYLSLKKRSDEEYCRLVVRNALFCTFEVAKKIEKGNLGAKVNKKHGNKYYSWFCYGFQRKAIGQSKGQQITILPSQSDPEKIGKYVLDDNSKANEAIKRAIMAGFPNWMKTRFNVFKDYMACHIWDKTCYDYRYHTSVFNLVLLPQSIGGLSDYNTIVKELLQYEAAMRFGVYPEGCNYKMSRPTKAIYNYLHDQWRQPGEHEIAMNNIKDKNFKIIELK